MIDKGKREGKGVGRFLLLGSAAVDLLAQSGETLAGRIALAELAPFDVTEVGGEQLDKLWVRGGFPDSFFARNGEASMRWRRDFIRTYLDLMVDLLLVRRLQPRLTNVGKRMVRSPKVYARDSGLVHALLGLSDKEAVLGHPVVGASWEGMVIENLLAVAGSEVEPSFYRTSAGAEVDLVLTWPDGREWAVEVKRSMSPKLERGARSALADIEPEMSFVVYPGTERYRLGDDTWAIDLAGLCAELLGPV